MIAINLILASAGLLQAATSLSLPTRKVLVNNILIPKVTTDFAKNNVTAQWAPGYPKEWGSEDYHYQFGDPDPKDNFEARITSDEKYLVMSNGTHVEFIDLEKNSTASVFAITIPDVTMLYGLNLRTTPQGGYDVIQGAATHPSGTVRTRISPDLKTVDKTTVYQGGIGDISKGGKLLTSDGYIYDLDDGTNKPVATLKLQPDITFFSFSPDGVHLASVTFHTIDTADLWNATSGEKIFQFPQTPQTKGQSLATRFSPDGKYIAIGCGDGSYDNVIQIYTLSNLTAPPTELKGFNSWPRRLDWSPDSKSMAVGDALRLQIIKVPSGEVVQKWEVERSEYEYVPADIKWLEEGNKLTWRFGEGTRYLYDFEKNVKWYWTLSTLSHSWDYNYFSLFSKKGIVATLDGDSTVRFWKI